MPLSGFPSTEAAVQELLEVAGLPGQRLMPWFRGPTTRDCELLGGRAVSDVPVCAGSQHRDGLVRMYPGMNR